MCGIVGGVTVNRTGFRADEVDTFLEALYYDAMRGLDSTGVMGINTSGNVLVHKEASQAGVFLQSKEMKDFRQQAIWEGKFLVGHNRAATRGKITDENAHPFIVDNNIVLLQNGTWKGSHKHIKDVEVDTEALAHVIHEAGDSVVDAFKDINAAFALCWYNVKQKTVYLARNSERPLWLCHTKHGSIFWCSEPGFIRLAAIRNRLEVEKMEEVPEDTLIPIKLEDNKAFTFMEQQKLPQFRPPPVEVVDKSWPYTGEYVPPVRLPLLPIKGPQQQQPRKEVADIDFLTGFHMCPDSTDYFVSNQEAGQIQQQMLAVMSTKQPIELHDYIAANNHPQCSTFFVWGTIITPGDSSPLDKFVVYWIMRNTTEAAMLDYVSKGIYSAKVCTTKTMRISADESCVVGMGSETSKIETLQDVLH